jgi:hypothetical protein
MSEDDPDGDYILSQTVAGVVYVMILSGMKGGMQYTTGGIRG